MPAALKYYYYSTLNYSVSITTNPLNGKLKATISSTVVIHEGKRYTQTHTHTHTHTHRLTHTHTNTLTQAHAQIHTHALSHSHV